MKNKGDSTGEQDSKTGPNLTFSLSVNILSISVVTILNAFPLDGANVKYFLHKIHLFFFKTLVFGANFAKGAQVKSLFPTLIQFNAAFKKLDQSESSEKRFLLRHRSALQFFQNKIW